MRASIVSCQVEAAAWFRLLSSLPPSKYLQLLRVEPVVSPWLWVVLAATCRMSFSNNTLNRIIHSKSLPQDWHIFCNKRFCFYARLSRRYYLWDKTENKIDWKG